jgi:hypothetical protein
MPNWVSIRDYFFRTLFFWYASTLISERFLTLRKRFLAENGIFGEHLFSGGFITRSTQEGRYRRRKGGAIYPLRSATDAFDTKDNWRLLPKLIGLMRKNPRHIACLLPLPVSLQSMKSGWGKFLVSHFWCGYFFFEHALQGNNFFSAA